LVYMHFKCAAGQSLTHDQEIQLSRVGKVCRNDIPHFARVGEGC
jgi:hypothetical protein